MRAARAARAEGVRGASIRVALLATVLVAAVYVAIGAAVVLLVTHDLTQQIDDRLVASLSHIGDEPGGPPDSGYGAPPPDRFGPATLVWTIQADGTVQATNADAVLPTTAYHVTAPQTVMVGDVALRVAGGAAGDDYVIVGQTLDTVSQATSTILLAEVLIAPVLLVVVFLGAVAIGRRVAEPIERARQRQLAFTADASHELRTPLSVIEAQASLAATQPRTVDWYARAFQGVDREARRMRHLVDDLLWLARFDALQGRPQLEHVDLGIVAAHAVDRFAPVAEHRHLALHVVVPPEPAVVQAPADWLDRLLGVLMDNACKYSPEGGEVTVTVGHDGGRVRLTVDDAGPGIPAEEQTRIFDRFHRATSAGSGAGLGLAIADSIVRASRGAWRLGRSGAGGASISVSWPRGLA
ncbi:MAG TPA: HAMP domain-containing sensor histidine kinase [Candidatus Baltobacteraceae bacterium]|nr:HAMP domain-containing sensor histidine kinase [Candidatus Baltobacteraceae bacterium]